MKSVGSFKMIARWSATLALASFVIFAIVNCGQKNDKGMDPNNLTEGAAPQVSPTFSSLYNKVFSNACASCHSPTGVATGRGATLDFSSASAGYKSLLSASASGLSSASCSQVRIVAAGNPTKSYLMAVMVAKYNVPNFGQPGCAPYGNHLQDQNLTPNEQSALLTWIQSGAPNN